MQPFAHDPSNVPERPSAYAPLHPDFEEQANELLNDKEGMSSHCVCGNFGSNLNLFGKIVVCKRMRNLRFQLTYCPYGTRETTSRFSFPSEPQLVSDVQLYRTINYLESDVSCNCLSFFNDHSYHDVVVPVCSRLWSRCAYFHYCDISFKLYFKWPDCPKLMSPRTLKRSKLSSPTIGLGIKRPFYPHSMGDFVEYRSVSTDRPASSSSVTSSDVSTGTVGHIITKPVDNVGGEQSASRPSSSSLWPEDDDDEMDIE